MKLKLLAATLFAAMSTVASANTPITAGSGWQYDEIPTPGAESTGSNWTFAVAAGERTRFLVTDAYIPGDRYFLWSGSTLLKTSIFYAGAPTGGADPYGFEPAWQSADYSKISYRVGEGIYSLTIKGDGAAGTPAGFGVQLLAVPEPSTYALMLLGLGVAGFVARRRAGAGSV